MQAQTPPTNRGHKLLRQSTGAELPHYAGVKSPALPLDAVFPEQFYGPPRGAARVQSQMTLMHAVLDDAINCYQKQFLPSTRHEQRLASEAAEWLFSNDDRWPFSFVNVCHALGLDPEYLRRGLKQWRQRPLAAAFRKQRRSGRGRRMTITT